MGYSLDEWFDDTVLPKLKQFVEQTELDKPLNAECITNVNAFFFVECRFKKPLPFDFYLPDYNTLIEFDGIQHFEPFSFGSDLSNENKLKVFQDTCFRDKIKTDFCRFKKLSLIRIPYKKINEIPKIIINSLIDGGANAKVSELN
ncbi:MAG: hypothetical protein PHF86_07815 [Candidatus Nanoarchaeia archaeon]|jgi:hypothetical protein|nr:hypothetical protein [Candidatus Nanoarchaeia archaeon]